MLLIQSNRMSAWLSTMIFIAILCHCATATFFVADVGTESVKLAIPRDLRVDICLNEMSERKSPNFIGFRNLDPSHNSTTSAVAEERFFGSDAKNLLPRFPQQMIPGVVRLLGLTCSDSTSIQATLQKEGFTFDVVCNDVSRTVDILFPSTDPKRKRQFSVFNLFAMQVANWKSTVEKCIDGPVRDAIFVVPSYLNQAQRLAIVNSAAAAGVRVLDVLHTTTAVALQHAYQTHSTGVAKPSRVLIMDHGAGLTEAAVYSFQPPSQGAGKVSNVHALGTIKLLGAIQSNTSLGSRSFDLCIARYLEDEFVTKTGLPRVLGGTSAAEKKAIVSLIRAATKAKEMLSANQEAPVTVEGLAPSRDFTTTLTRATFENVCRHITEEVVRLRDAALASADVPLASIERVEVFGGGVRVPMVAAALAEGYRRDQVDRTLNTDESAVLGAGSFALITTGHLRMRGFHVADRTSHESQFVVQRREQSDNSNKAKCSTIELWGAGTVVPMRRVVNVKIGTIGMSDLLQGIQQAESEVDKSDRLAVLRSFVWDAVIVTGGVVVDTTVVNDSDAKLSAALVDSVLKWRATQPKTLNVTNVDLALAFIVFMSHGSIVQIEDVNLLVTIHALRAVKKNTTTTTTVTADNNSETSSASSAAAETDEDSSSQSASSASTTEESPASESAAYVSKKFDLVLPLALHQADVQLQCDGLAVVATTQMTFEDLLASRSETDRWSAREAEAAAVSAARNEFESFLIWARGEGFVANHTVQSTVATDVYDAYCDDLQKAADWFEDLDSATTKADELLRELNKLKRKLHRVLHPNDSSKDVDDSADVNKKVAAEDPFENLIPTDDEDVDEDDDSEL